MGRLVNIQDLPGEKGRSEDLYRGDDRKYYSSKAVYDAIQTNKMYRVKCIEWSADILGYPSAKGINTLIPKNISELKDYGYEVVYETMVRSGYDVKNILHSKKFNTEYNRIQYVFAIIKNKILPVYNEYQNKIKQENKSDYIVTSDELTLHRSETKNTDVSSLLGDEEWI